jgi:hypothetical protein
VATDTYPDTEQFPLFCIEAVMASLLFGFFFGATYTGYALWFEATIMLTLSGANPTYGQQCGVACVMLTGLGSTVGLAIAIGRHFSVFWGALLPAVCSFGLAIASWGYWQQSMAEYGRAPYDWILFVPLLCVAIVVHVLSLLVAIVSRRTRRTNGGGSGVRVRSS